VIQTKGGEAEISVLGVRRQIEGDRLYSDTSSKRKKKGGDPDGGPGRSLQVVRRWERRGGIHAVIVAVREKGGDKIRVPATRLDRKRKREAACLPHYR